MCAPLYMYCHLMLIAKFLFGLDKRKPAKEKGMKGKKAHNKMTQMKRKLIFDL